MSIDTCKDCGTTVDTDDEPEAYSLIHEDGTEEETDVCRCKDCRYWEESVKVIEKLANSMRRFELPNGEILRDWHEYPIVIVPNTDKSAGIESIERVK